MNLLSAANKQLFLLILLVSLEFPGVAFADLNMGVFPRRKPNESLTAFKPLANYLEKKLHTKVKLVLPRTFAEFWRALENNQFDLVHFNQFHYVKSHDQFGYQVILTNVEHGQESLRTIISTHSKSNIRSLDDLKGQTVLFGGGKMAMASYIMPSIMLKRHGLLANVDYRVRFAKNPLLAVVAVYEGHAPIAATGKVVLELNQVKERINTQNMRIIAESEPYPHLPWAVSRQISEQQGKTIAQVMHAMQQDRDGKVILKLMEVDRFNIANDKDFDSIRLLLRNNSDALKLGLK